MPQSPLADPPSVRRAGGPEPPLGPSDSSDTASDVAGAEPRGTGNPAMPVDRALDADVEALPGGRDAAASGTDSDAGGTGERSSAAGDAPRRDGADISTDHVIDADGGPDDLPPPDGDAARTDLDDGAAAGPDDASDHPLERP